MVPKNMLIALPKGQITQCGSLLVITMMMMMYVIEIMVVAKVVLILS